MVTSCLLTPYCITGCLRKTCLSFVPCAFLVLPLSYLNPTSAVPRVPGIPSLWQLLGIPAQLFLLGSPRSPDIGRLSFSFRGFWAYHPFFFVVNSSLLWLLVMGLAHCVISLGLGIMIFLISTLFYQLILQLTLHPSFYFYIQSNKII